MGATGGAGSGGIAGNAGVGGMAGSAGAGGSAAVGGSGGMAAAAGASGGAGAGGCPADMVRVEGQAFTEYCIDETEVTAAAYRAFLDTSPSTTGQPASCASNDDFSPRTDGGSDNTCNAGVYDPSARPMHPVTCVDWCDAHAYCTWAGKRLCGNYAASGGALATNQVDDWTLAEHFNACSASNTSNYPWGDTSAAANCVTSAFDGDPGVQGTDVARPVKSAALCEGATPGVFDLSGNVREWENACSGSNCSARGGSFLVAFSAQECDDNQLVDRFTADWATGFRCCAGP